MHQKTWLRQPDGKIYQAFMPDAQTEIPKGIYTIGIDQQNQFFLQKQEDEFKFPFKIYGLEQGFIDTVVRTYENTDGNMGVLMNGLQGTGKTVAAKIIANTLNLPILLINGFDKRLPGFLGGLHQEMIIFIDEYDKIFESSNVLLSVMDGATASSSRKMFLLTSNENNASRYMINRPSRIRYVRNFGNLKNSVIHEIMDDRLEYAEYRQDIINYLSKVKLVTIDVVKTVIEEVNIHQKSPKDFAGYFNCEIRDRVPAFYAEGKYIDQRVFRRWDYLATNLMDAILSNNFIGKDIITKDGENLGRGIAVYPHKKMITMKLHSDAFIVEPEFRIRYPKSEETDEYPTDVIVSLRYEEDIQKRKMDKWEDVDEDSDTPIDVSSCGWYSEIKGYHTDNDGFVGGSVERKVSLPRTDSILTQAIKE